MENAAAQAKKRIEMRLVDNNPKGSKKVKATHCKKCGDSFAEQSHRVRDGAFCTVHRLAADTEYRRDKEAISRAMQMRQSMRFCPFCSKVVLPLHREPVCERVCARACLRQPVCESLSARARLWGNLGENARPDRPRWDLGAASPRSSRNQTAI